MKLLIVKKKLPYAKNDIRVGEIFSNKNVCVKKSASGILSKYLNILVKKNKSIRLVKTIQLLVKIFKCYLLFFKNKFSTVSKI